MACVRPRRVRGGSLAESSPSLRGDKTVRVLAEGDKVTFACSVPRPGLPATTGGSSCCRPAGRPASPGGRRAAVTRYRSLRERLSATQMTGSR